MWNVNSERKQCVLVHIDGERNIVPSFEDANIRATYINESDYEDRVYHTPRKSTQQACH